MRSGFICDATDHVPSVYARRLDMMTFQRVRACEREFTLEQRIEEMLVDIVYVAVVIIIENVLWYKKLYREKRLHLWCLQSYFERVWQTSRHKSKLSSTRHFLTRKRNTSNQVGGSLCKTAFFNFNSRSTFISDQPYGRKK